MRTHPRAVPGVSSDEPELRVFERCSPPGHLDAAAAVGCLLHLRLPRQLFPPRQPEWPRSHQQARLAGPRRVAGGQQPLSGGPKLACRPGLASLAGRSALSCSCPPALCAAKADLQRKNGQQLYSMLEARLVSIVAQFPGGHTPSASCSMCLKCSRLACNLVDASRCASRISSSSASPTSSPASR